MIKYYDLRGYHASAQLTADIHKVFGSLTALSIPRYALMKGGRLVADHAKSPQDPALKDQLDRL